MGNKYRIGRKIGSGSFGDIYLGMTHARQLMLGNHCTKTSQAPTSSPARRLLSSLSPSRRSTHNWSMRLACTSRWLVVLVSLS